MIPPRPEDILAHGTAKLFPRFEDVAQDGRLVLGSMMHGMGAAIWPKLPPADDFVATGILPILSRLVMEAGAAPISVHLPIEYEGFAAVAREEDGERLFLNLWLEARAPIASTFGPKPIGEPVVIGRLFAEHVMTKPFAPPAERRVTALPNRPMPTNRHRFENAEALVKHLALEPLAEITFGLMHTDSNQHVNSLVYPRVFEERMAAGARISTATEIRFRKPFFLGDRAQIRASSDGFGTFSPVGEAKPSCTIRMQLR